jgi:hypothetical protein
VTVRTDNPPFLKRSDIYLRHLGAKLKSLQVTHGGPILMAQVENEYGNFGHNHAYTTLLRDVFREHFDIVLYTTDAGNEGAQIGGHIPGVLAEVDGNPYDGFGNLTEYRTDPSNQGPLLNGEYYSEYFRAIDILPR